ncbi:MAG: DUF5989 family protein [Actinomycetota bacterium]|nr:DUF5989 family protein [Actinomycetota bacterium]
MAEEQEAPDFEDAASRPRHGFASDVWSFVWRNKRWWMIPMIVVLALLGLLVLVTGSGAGAFIYPLF